MKILFYLPILLLACSSVIQAEGIEDALKEDVEFLIQEHHLELGNDRVVDVDIKKMDKLNGLCLGSLCIVKTPHQYYAIINGKNEEVGNIIYYGERTSVQNVRRRLLRSFFCYSGVKKLKLKQDIPANDTWIVYSTVWPLFGEEQHPNHCILTIDNLGIEISIFDDFPIKKFVSHIYNVLKDKADSTACVNLQRVKDFQRVQVTKKKLEEERLNKQSQERDRQGFPGYGQRICNYRDMPNSCLAKEIGTPYILNNLIPSSDILNLFVLEDLKQIWKGKFLDQGDKTQGMVAKLGNREKCIFILVMRFATKEEAKARLVQYRYVNPKDISIRISFLSEENVKAQTKINPRLVGELIWA